MLKKQQFWASALPRLATGVTRSWFEPLLIDPTESWAAGQHAEMALLLQWTVSQRCYQGCLKSQAIFVFLFFVEEEAQNVFGQTLVTNFTIQM